MAASASDEAVRLVSAAHEASRDGVVSILDKLTEFLIHRHPECLPALLHKVLELKVHPSPAVKRAVLNFVDALVHARQEHMPDVIATLSFLVQCEQAGVVRRALALSTVLFRRGFRMLATTRPQGDGVKEEQFWNELSSLRQHVEAQLASSNDTSRTQAVKSLEMTTLILSLPNAADSRSLMRRATKPNSVTLGLLAKNHPFLAAPQLAQWGRAAVETLCARVVAAAGELPRLVREAEGTDREGLDAPPTPHPMQLSPRNLVQAASSLATLAAHRGQFVLQCVPALLRLGRAVVDVASAWGGTAPRGILGTLWHSCRVALLRTLKLRTAGVWWDELAALLKRMGWSNHADKALAAVRRAGTQAPEGLVEGEIDDDEEEEEGHGGGGGGGGGAAGGARARVRPAPAHAAAAGMGPDGAEGQQQPQKRFRSAGFGVPAAQPGRGLHPPVPPQAQAQLHPPVPPHMQPGHPRQQGGAVPSLSGPMGSPPGGLAARYPTVAGPPIEPAEIDASPARALAQLVVANAVRMRLPLPPRGCGQVPPSPRATPDGAVSARVYAALQRIAQGAGRGPAPPGQAPVQASHLAHGYGHGARQPGHPPAEGKAGVRAPPVPAVPKFEPPTVESMVASITKEALPAVADASFRRMLREWDSHKAISASAAQREVRAVALARTACLLHPWRKTALPTLVRYTLEVPTERVRLGTTLLAELWRGAEAERTGSAGGSAGWACAASMAGLGEQQYEAALASLTYGLLTAATEEEAEAALSHGQGAAAAAGGSRGGGGGAGHGSAAAEGMASGLDSAGGVASPEEEGPDGAEGRDESVSTSAAVGLSAASLLLACPHLPPHALRRLLRASAPRPDNALEGMGADAAPRAPWQVAVRVANALATLAVRRRSHRPLCLARLARYARSGTDAHREAAVAAMVGTLSERAATEPAVRACARVQLRAAASAKAPTAETVASALASASAGTGAGAGASNGGDPGADAGDGSTAESGAASASAADAAAYVDEDGEEEEGGSHAGAAAVEEAPAHVARRLLQLPLRLCARAPSLLPQVASVYAGAGPEVRVVIEEEIANIVRSLVVAYSSQRRAAAEAKEAKGAVALLERRSLAQSEAQDAMVAAVRRGAPGAVVPPRLLRGETAPAPRELLRSLAGGEQPGAEEAVKSRPLALNVLQVLCGAVQTGAATVPVASSPPEEMVSAAHELLTATGDGRWLTPVAAALQPQQVDRVIAAVAGMPGSDLQALLRTLHAVPHCAVKPADVLIRLHAPSGVGVALPTQLSALDACVNAVDVVTPSVLTKVLQTLALQTPRPPLMMRTAMLGCKLHEKLKASVVGLLSELVRGQAWKEEQLWSGVVRCCEMLGERAYNVLLQVPSAEVLQGALAIAPGVKEGLAAYVRDNPAVASNVLPELVDVLTT